MVLLQERLLTDPEIKYLFHEGILYLLVPAILIVAGISTISIGAKRFGEALRGKNGLALPSFFIFISVFIMVGAIWGCVIGYDFANDAQSHKANIISSTIIGTRTTHYGKGGPEFYLDFPESTPVTELQVLQSIYNELKVGNPVTISYAPRTKVVLTINGVEQNYKN